MQRRLIIFTALLLSSCNQTSLISSSQSSSFAQASFSSSSSISSANQSSEVFEVNPLLNKLSDLAFRVSDLNVCKIQEPNKTQNYFQQKGFPYKSWIPISGELNIGILAVDFPDVAGEQDFLPIYQSQIKDLENWSSFVSGGKMTYKVHFPNQWIRAPKEARFYTNLQSRLNNQQYWGAAITEDLQPTEESLRQILVAADNYIDWSIINFLQILFPLASGKYGVFVYSHGADINTPRAGKVNFPVFGDVVTNFSPISPDPLARTMWDWVVHEALHFQGVNGHGPLNGGPYSIMMNQHGPSKALLSWESFLLDYFDDRHIACVETDNLNEELILQLESLDKTGAQPGIKSLMIPLNETELIVVEYRTNGPFSTLTPDLTGFTAYYINTTLESVRCDSCNQDEMELLNFWRYIRNKNQILKCENNFNTPIGLCESPSIVQRPGYKLDFKGINFEFHNDGIVSVKRTDS
jgi:hypothetical protein